MPSSDDPVITSARGKVGDDNDGYCNPGTYTHISYHDIALVLGAQVLLLVLVGLV